MKCPKDGATLERDRYEDVDIDRCPSCGGVWLDRGEMKRVHENLADDHSEQLAEIGSIAQSYEFARQRAQRPGQCPKCQVPMVDEEYGYCSQILIDRCPECLGIWLDEGELEALEAFFEVESGARRELSSGFWASLFH